jgi:hypothetical protein
VHCIEFSSRPRAARWRGRPQSHRLLGGLLIGLVLAGCGALPDAEPASASSATPAAPAAPPQSSSAPRVPSPAAATTHSVRAAAPLPPPNAVRTVDELKLQAARRIVAANPDLVYAGPVPEQLLAIPVLSVDLNADGSIRRVQVMRYPTQAADTTQIAIDALKRAAPFGNVSRLAKPWRFSETFLFNDERRFKPRTLDN